MLSDEAADHLRAAARTVIMASPKLQRPPKQQAARIEAKLRAILR
jgi:hypothetical protein